MESAVLCAFIITLITEKVNRLTKLLSDNGQKFFYCKELIAMPYKPKVPCKHSSCPNLVENGEYYCSEHKKLHEGMSGRGAAERGYNSRWQKVSKAFLKVHPLCVRCQAEGRYVKATVVDHIIPHKGDGRLFWDRENWQPLCKHHHDKKTMNEDIYYTEEYRYD